MFDDKSFRLQNAIMQPMNYMCALGLSVQLSLIIYLNRIVDGKAPWSKNILSWEVEEYIIYLMLNK